MKINICLLLSSLLFFNNLKSAELVIKILNIDENIGSIHFAVYDKPDFFPYILFTVSCNLYTYLENVFLLFIHLIVNGYAM